MNIIITGASRGIGAALSRNFVGRGGHRLFILSRNNDVLMDFRDELLSLNQKSEIVILNYDLAKAGIYSEITNKISEFTDTIDILINNAGSIVVKAFEEFTKEDIDQQFAVNYMAPAQLIQSLIPFLRKSELAHVVNISSMAGFQGSKKFPGLSHYSASKAAIAALTESLAEEFNQEIVFNALCIGAVQTEMLEEAFPGYIAPVNPDEMAEYIADFALKSHMYMNGRVLPVSLGS